MKRGFLNTQKAKQRVEKAVDPETTNEPSHKESKDKDTMKRGFLNTQKAKQSVEKAVDSETTNEASHKESKDESTKRECRCSPNTGIRHFYCGFDPHKLPFPMQDEAEIIYGKSRLVFRSWPRDPKGLPMHRSPIAFRGKEAGNGIDLWGATLYDFYHVQRVVDMPEFVTISSGSRLAKWVRQTGELIAKDELAWADEEEDPKEIPVADIGELIACYDKRVKLGTLDQYSSRKEIREKAKSSLSGSSYIAEIEDKGGSIPPARDQGDNTDETSPKKGADQPKVQPAAPLPNIDSPFHPDHYPSPYPFIPCTHDDNPTLQQRIPLYLLPQKLYVHDPWNKLSITKGDSDHETPWLSKVAKRDIVRTYSLSLSPEGKETALKEQKQVEMAEEKAGKDGSVLRIFPSEKEGPTEEPLIEVILPPRPRKRTQVEEAHLYVAPRKVGVGNHSVVHSVEWELPRDLFVEARLCNVCVELDVRQQIQKLKDEGKWEELLKNTKGKPEETSEAGPDVAPGTESSEASGAKRTVDHVTIKERHLPEVTGEFIIKKDFKNEPSADANVAEPASGGDPPADTASHAAEAGNTQTDVKMDAIDGQDPEPGAEVEQEEAPDVEVKVDDTEESSTLGEDNGKGKEKPEQDDGDEEKADAEENEAEQSEKEEIFTIKPPSVIRIASYSGPVLRIHTNLKWEGPSERCGHGGDLGSGDVPRTATVKVVAKLSIKYDPHLAREASNYQSFPDHFFQHWNGYNVMPPIHDPVPVGALCPQFYGYYTPDNPSDGRRHPHYLSPILLLEHCGSQIDPEKLCKDDKQECASFIFRFHHAGWLHESFAARNILWQQGKPTDQPIQRPNSSKSFRLIDFGRSIKLDELEGRGMEKETALSLFGLFPSRITLNDMKRGYMKRGHK